MKREQLINRFNVASEKLNQLENDGNGIYELIPVDYKGKITLEDVEYMENHYIEMKERYQELKIGIYE